MQYVWQHRLWPHSRLRTVDGRLVRIIDPGRLNTDAGPDFFNAKIAIDGRIWAGDVEIHVRASDWHRHGHDKDPAYDSVILHVVDRDDTAIHRRNGEIIPQMQMACTPDFNRRYARLVETADRDLPCAETIVDMPSVYTADWIDALAFERIYAKADHINRILDRFGGDWDSTAYVTLARCLGFGLNGEPFERLALSVPLMFIAKHCDSLLTIEALLFGQSGLLDTARADDYTTRLQKEYAFMCHKFGLRRPQPLGWKMSRMRPANFPHRRIATLAALLHDAPRLMSRILETDTPDKAADLFTVNLTGYWINHYTFGAPSSGATQSLSRSSVVGLAINAIAPLKMAYGMAHDDSRLTDGAIALLQSLPPERNSIVDMFKNTGIKLTDAFSTQGVIQLRREYCNPRKCLYCRIGHRMLAARTPRD